MSSDARSRRSISKQRGAAMSSRLIPPKTGATASTVRTISSTSFVASASGKASTFANSLKSSALPSITGKAASGPMSPRPSTALPSVTTATVLRLIVRFQTFSGSSAIARDTRATPGVYAIERSSRVFSGSRGAISILPPRCARNVRSETLTTLTPPTARTASTTRARWRSSSARTVTSRSFVCFSTRTRSIDPSSPPASPMAAASRAKAPGRLSIRRRIVALKDADGCMVRTVGRVRCGRVRANYCLAVRITLCDVGPRDGLQNEPESLEPAVRADLVNRLAAAGLPRVEAVSFVRDERVPRMAGAEDVVAGIERRAGTAYVGLVLNERGWERFVQTGLDRVTVTFGATEGFNQANGNRTLATAVAGALAILDRAGDASVPVTVTLSVAFGCPFEGDVDPGVVAELAGRFA